MPTVKQLQDELKCRGASTRGRKQELIDRLEAYERNDDFHGPSVSLPAELLPDWPVAGFKTLTPMHRQIMPQLLKGHITNYIEFRMAVDRMINNDCKAIVKGKALLDSNRVRTASFHKNGSHTYFTGMVQAMMKKKVTYSVRVKLHEKGNVINSDCECPAGAGPHSTCKHVAALLFMLLDFAQEGKMKTQRSCTDVLQTFHKPSRQYTGSPVKAEHLPRKRKTTVNLDDPRPPKYRCMPGYNDFVYNRIINFCSMTSKDLSLRYIYRKADIQTAAVDHMYLDRPFTEYWVDRGIQVTCDSVRSIEKETRGQAKATKWFEHREWRIGASKQGDVCHATGRRNMLKLCQDIVSPPQLQTAAVLHGQSYEEDARKKFEQVTAKTVKKCGLFTSIDYPYLAATPDGLVGDTHVLEIKCPYSGRELKIKPGKYFSFLTENNGKLAVKKTHKYYDQIQSQMGITGRSHCYFVVFTFADFCIIEVPFDANYWQGSMIAKLELFYEKYFRNYLANHL